MISELERNLARLSLIEEKFEYTDAKLKKMRHLSQKLVSRVRYVIKNLDIQPKIYPTPRGSLQIQYEPKDDSYYEAELFKDGKVSVMVIPENKDYENAIFYDFTDRPKKLIDSMNQFAREREIDGD